jgi:hypothetical protein
MPSASISSVWVIAANSINLAISALERASREISIPKIAPTSPEQTRLTSSVNPSRTLASAYNAAVDLRALGEYQRARALDGDTLTRYRRVLGDDHPIPWPRLTTLPST